MRWRCPDCGSSVNAPQRPRKDDVRRYCLGCSERSGRLVGRSAPVLEAKRAKAAERTAAKRRRLVEREREALSIAGVHLPSEAAKMLRGAATLRVAAPRLRASRIEFKVRRCSRRPRVLGHATPAWRRIMVADYPGITPEAVRATLLHEIVHLCVGADPNDRARWHGRAFRRTLKDAADELA